MRPHGAFLLISLVAGVSFCGNHLTGLFVAGWDDNPLLYSPLHVRLHPKPKYRYVPNTLSYDETSEYARFVQEVRRGEWAGPAIESYQSYALDPIPGRTFWWRDRLGLIAVALLALPFSGSVPHAFLAADFVFPALVALTLLFLAWRLHPDLSFGMLSVSVVLWFKFGVYLIAREPTMEIRDNFGVRLWMCQVRHAAMGAGEGLHRRHDDRRKACFPSCAGVTHATSRRSPLSRVRENRKHGLKGS